MPIAPWSIAWKGRLVGWLAEPKIDQPFFYGRWVGGLGPETAEFLTALQQAITEGSGLDVLVAETLTGTAYSLPDDNGNLDIRWVWLIRRV